MKPINLLIFGAIIVTVVCFKTGTMQFGQPISLDALESNHYMITTCALYEMVINYLKDVHGLDHLETDFQVYNGTCKDLSMFITNELKTIKINSIFFRQAREEIALANIMTDTIYDPAPYTHFDNEEFENGSKFVTIQLRAIQSSLAHREWLYARMSIGFLLHTLQDFYSHSNWIELGMFEPNQDLATGRRIGSVASKDIETCRSCNGSDEYCNRNNVIVNQYLTSGYFSYIYPIDKPSGKCNHGYACYFPGENDEYCEGISKDGLNSPHDHLHHRAASVAYNATVKLLNELRSSTNSDTFGRFLGLKNTFSLVFVIDVSKRLQSLVDMLVIVVSQLTDLLPTLPIEPSSYILSPYNDSHWGPVHSVSNINDFLDLIQELNKIDLSYSSDFYYDALNEALKVCESNSLIFMFTDAPTHKPCSQGSIRELSRLKRTKIDVLFVDTPESTSRTINELNNFTETIGSLFIHIDMLKPKLILQFIYHRLKESFNYERIRFHSMSNHNQGIFIIDTTATSFRINVVTRSSSFNFLLMDPTGLIFQPTSFSSSDQLQMFSIDINDSSHVGPWTYSCSENCTIEVNIKSEFRCRTNLYTSLSDPLGIMIVMPPLFNQSGVLAITSCDDSSDAINHSIQLVDVNGEILSNSLMTSDFVVNIGIPLQSFRMRTEIERRDGSIAYREESILIETSQIVMAIDNQPLIATNDEHFNITFKIRNDADESLYVQLNIDNVLETSKWYSMKPKSIINDFIFVDTCRYILQNEIVRFIPLIFSLQAFKNNENLTADEIRFRHEQFVALYIYDSSMYLEPPTHFININ